MEFNFTPRTIKEIEDKAKKPFVEMIGDYSMSTVALFVAKGTGVSEDQAFEALDKYFADGGELHNLYLEILEQLQKKGFLPKSVQLQQIKERLNQGI